MKSSTGSRGPEPIWKSKDAVREATRDGAPAIDLIDGDLLLDKLKDLGLGVQTQTIEIEQVAVDRELFANV